MGTKAESKSLFPEQSGLRNMYDIGLDLVHRGFCIQVTHPPLPWVGDWDKGILRGDHDTTVSVPFLAPGPRSTPHCLSPLVSSELPITRLWGH